MNSRVLLSSDFQEPEALQEIALALIELANHDSLSESDLMISPIGKNLIRLVDRRERLQFLLPAFPAKSPNPEKTIGVQPDLGEVIALKRLQRFCGRIDSVYEPGCEIVICSDGRVFNDLVLVSDEDLKLYQSGIIEIISDFELKNLRTFSLDDLQEVKDRSYDEMRRHLVREYGPSVETIRSKVGRCSEFRDLFNGVHRFIKEDRFSLFKDRSRNSVSLESKEIAYQVISRSDAWSNLLSERHPGALRLSIHPYPLMYEKFGVRLLPAQDRWATPWHNVTVKTGSEYVLMKRAEAVARGASLRAFGGQYAYFEI